MIATKSEGNRKIFFLHPQSVLQDELARALIEENFEAYLLRNHVSAKLILRDFPTAILLVQVDSGLEEDRWIEFANDLKSSPVFTDLTICVLSVSNIDEINKTFRTNSNAFSYAFSYGKYDFASTYASIKTMLETEKAKPPGFIVRATAPDRLKVSIVFARDGNRYEGLLRDISSTGMTCKIANGETLLPSEIPVQSIIITYRDTQFAVGGRIAGSSDSDNTIHLILFDEMATVNKKGDIYKLIHTCLQAQIEERIAEKSKAGRSRPYRK